MTPGQEIEPGAHGCEVSERACSLVTAPSLLPAKYRGYERLWKGITFQAPKYISRLSCAF